MIDIKAAPFNLDDEGVKWVEETKQNMTLEEKIGQLMIPIGYSADPGYLQHVMLDHHIGGILYRCGESEEMQACHRWLQEHSKIPLFIAANLEAGGDGIATDGTSFGKQMEIAATGDPEQAYRLGKVSCAEGKAVGCNWAFAPVVDIDRNWRNPITNVRTYGDDPEFVLKCGLAYKRAADEENVAVSIKHFPGDGCDEVDQHILTSVNNLSCEEWDETYGKIYKGLIDDGALTVMVGHIAQPAYQKHFNPDFPDKLVPATLSSELLQGLLRGRLGFNGLISTDSTCMLGFTVGMKREMAVPYSIEAGCDMFLFNKDLHEDYQYMMEGYKNGTITEERLNDALHRILGLKAALNLHIHKKEGTLMPPKEGLSVVGCPEHHQIAAQIADQYVTLVKDRENYLPMTPEKYKRIKLVFIGGEGRVIAGQLLKGNDEVIKADVIRQLEEAGFEVDAEEPVLKGKMEEFKKRFDAVLLILSVEGFAQYNVMRVKWNLPIKQPWYMSEVPTIVASLTYPNMLIDVPMARCYANAYMNHPEAVHALIEKLMGRCELKGAYNENVFCGRWETRF